MPEVVLDFLSSVYPWTKALHVISMVAWMAGLFYLPRLFVYHAEKVETGSSTDEMFQTMERRLFKAIMRPAMMATWTFGLLLALTPGVVDWSAGWVWVKAGGILAMTGFHEWCGKTVGTFAAGRNEKPGRFFRVMNEVPTVLLIVIVIMVFVRPF